MNYNMHYIDLFEKSTYHFEITHIVFVFVSHVSACYPARPYVV